MALSLSWETSYHFIIAMGAIYGFFTAIGAHTFFFDQGPKISLRGADTAWQNKFNNKFSRHAGIAEIRPWVITIKVAKLSSSIFEWTLLFHFPPVFTLILPTLICWVFFCQYILRSVCQFLFNNITSTFFSFLSKRQATN